MSDGHSLLDAAPTRGTYDVSLPAKLAPNRGPNFGILLVFLGVIGVAAFHYIELGPAGVGLSIEVAPAPSSKAPLGRLAPWLALAIFIAVMIFCVWREFTYFGSGGSYFFGLSPQGVTVSSPLVLRRFAWDQIERFGVVARHGRARHGGPRSSYSVRANLRKGGWFQSGVVIAQADFAKDLGIDRADCAEILCAFLNEVRDRVREAERAGTGVVVPVPHGLHVVAWHDMTPTPAAAEPAPAATAGFQSARKPTITRD
jgi:hypothetical protein